VIHVGLGACSYQYHAYIPLIHHSRYLSLPTRMRVYSFFVNSCVRSAYSRTMATKRHYSFTARTTVQCINISKLFCTYILYASWTVELGRAQAQGYS